MTNIFYMKYIKLTFRDNNYEHNLGLECYYYYDLETKKNLS